MFQQDNAKIEYAGSGRWLHVVECYWQPFCERQQNEALSGCVATIDGITGQIKGDAEHCWNWVGSVDPTNQGSYTINGWYTIRMAESPHRMGAR